VGKEATGRKRQERKLWKDSSVRNWWVCGGVAGKLARGIDLALPRGAGAPNRILPRRGRHGSADSFIGLVPAQTSFWGRRRGHIFSPEPK
jgi:hypothetical protein